MLPLGTSAVTLGFGYIVAFSEPPLEWRASAWLVPFAHALLALPFVVRTLTPTLRSIDPHLREAARVMGATPALAWREIDWPILARGIAVAATFAFAVSVGEFGATLMVAGSIVGKTQTLSIAVYEAVQAGQDDTANFLVAITSITCIAVLLSAGRLVPGRVLVRA